MKISQREARRLKKRVAELEWHIESTNRIWALDYPGGVSLGSVEEPDWLFYSVQTARKLGHAVVVSASLDEKKLRFHALKGMKA